MWSLTSPRATRVSVPKNFRSSPQKGFCNKICRLRKKEWRISLVRDDGLENRRKSEAEKPETTGSDCHYSNVRSLPADHLLAASALSPCLPRWLTALRSGTGYTSGLPRNRRLPTNLAEC